MELKATCEQRCNVTLKIFNPMTWGHECLSPLGATHTHTHTHARGSAMKVSEWSANTLSALALLAGRGDLLHHAE